jgi:hypothetical protein
MTDRSSILYRLAGARPLEADGASSSGLACCADTGHIQGSQDLQRAGVIIDGQKKRFSWSRVDTNRAALDPRMNTVRLDVALESATLS